MSKNINSQFDNNSYKKIQEVFLVASGDLRLSANQICWPTQEKMEKDLSNVFSSLGVKIIRAHPYDEKTKHGFIWNQRMGMDVFNKIPSEAPVIVAESVWQYSYHVLAGLREHKGLILTIANWSGQYPGLVGLLNLNGSLTKMGVKYSTIWSKNFDDEYFLSGIHQWLEEGKITHNYSHVRDLDIEKLPQQDLDLGRNLAIKLKNQKAIIGVFDEGCMGMYNAIIDDEFINPMGIYKERLSQSALYAKMLSVGEEESFEAKNWLDKKGMKFITGSNPDNDLTNDQILTQLKMYIAALRIASDFGCDAIGIQYQQGLKDLTPASDLAEGLLNNVDRPPVFDLFTGEELFKGKPLPHFNEVDEGAAIDAIVTNWVWTSMGLDPATTLHDIRWGDYFLINGKEEFVWVFLISGAAPASHFVGGYEGAVSERQPAMYFRLGGGTLKGISKPGEIVWSRVYLMNSSLHADVGRASVVELPEKEVERRWQLTDPQWPIMNAVLHGVTRDQLMAQQKANHVNVAYGIDVDSADHALAAKVSMFNTMGIQVHICGDVKVG